MSDIEFYKTTIEDIDGDEIEVSGDSRDGLVQVSLNFTVSEIDADADGFYSEVTPEGARVLAAALVMASTIAEGKGLGL